MHIIKLRYAHICLKDELDNRQKVVTLSTWGNHWSDFRVPLAVIMFRETLTLLKYRGGILELKFLLVISLNGNRFESP